MSNRFCPKYHSVLVAVRHVEEALEEINPDTVSRENWEDELQEFVEALEHLEEVETEMYTALYGEDSAKGRIREHLKDRVGSPVQSSRLERVSGISEYGRRVRELRNEEGFIIDSTRTRSVLGQNDYFVVGVHQDIEEKSRISARDRWEQLQEQSECENCGKDSNDPGVKYLEVDHRRPYVDHDDPKSVNDDENLWTLCNECHVGKTATERHSDDVEGTEKHTSVASEPQSTIGSFLTGIRR